MNIIEKIEKAQIEKYNLDRNFPDFGPETLLRLTLK